MQDPSGPMHTPHEAPSVWIVVIVMGAIALFSLWAYFKQHAHLHAPTVRNGVVEQEGRCVVFTAEGPLSADTTMRLQQAGEAWSKKYQSSTDPQVIEIKLDLEGQWPRRWMVLLVPQK